MKVNKKQVKRQTRSFLLDGMSKKEIKKVLITNWTSDIKDPKEEEQIKQEITAIVDNIDTKISDNEVSMLFRSNLDILNSLLAEYDELREFDNEDERTTFHMIDIIKEMRQNLKALNINNEDEFEEVSLDDIKKILKRAKN